MKRISSIDLREPMSRNADRLRAERIHRRFWLYLWAASAMGMAATGHSKDKPIIVPGCANESPQQCITAALEAMGGRERLQQVMSVRLQTVRHTLLMEQSYRQAPFITSYERGHISMDLANQRLITDSKLTWPE